MYKIHKVLILVLNNSKIIRLNVILWLGMFILFLLINKDVLLVVMNVGCFTKEFVLRFFDHIKKGLFTLFFHSFKYLIVVLINYKRKLNSTPVISLTIIWWRLFDEWEHKSIFLLHLTYWLLVHIFRYILMECKILLSVTLI